jgi:hypothetical protein
MHDQLLYALTRKHLSIQCLFQAALPSTSAGLLSLRPQIGQVFDGVSNTAALPRTSDESTRAGVLLCLCCKQVPCPWQTPLATNLAQAKAVVVYRVDRALLSQPRPGGQHDWASVPTDPACIVLG